MKSIILNDNDNVATAVNELREGQQIELKKPGGDIITVNIAEHIPFGHKLSLKKINHGEDVIKYGEVIGRALSDINEGQLAHVENIESLRGRGDIDGDK